MGGQQDHKKLERRAKSLLLNKEIPPGKMEAVRSLMNNSSINDNERYSAIIDLIKNCEDKKQRTKAKDSSSPVNRTKPSKITDPGEDKTLIDNSPTETSFYIDELLRKYKYLKIFKKRYLAHRNNRFGIGIRKRLIPHYRLIKIYKFLSDFQESMMPRFTQVLMDIINDESQENPEIFNYLRIFRKWMMETPLKRYSFDILKWMERNNFERELQQYLVYYFSFLIMDTAKKEEIIALFEDRLRNLDELCKEEVNEKDSDQSKRTKEKRNLEKEKIIYEYMMKLRSFITSGIKDDSLLSSKIKKQFNIKQFSDLLIITAEVLVFQRPVSSNEIINYFQITPPAVNMEQWDYNEDFLKKIGKDQASRKRKKLADLKEGLVPYDTLVQLLKIDDNGSNIIMKGVQVQWEHIDKKRHDPVTSYQEDFFTFLDGVIQYFRNSYIHILDGSLIYFRDPYRKEYESSIFAVSFFEQELNKLNSILDEMHFFKSNNPTLAVTRKEAGKIMKKQIKSMNNVEEYITQVGDFFYTIGKKLQNIYELHLKWQYNNSQLNDMNIIRIPIDTSMLETVHSSEGRPIPYHDCFIKDFYNNNPLTKKLINSKIIGQSKFEGLYVMMLAYAFQAAHECFNEHLLSELDERKRLMRKINDLSR